MCSKIIVYLIRRIIGSVDPSILTLGAAILSLATALTGLTTAILNRKASKKTSSSQENLTANSGWASTPSKLPKKLFSRNKVCYMFPSKKTHLINFVRQA